jgi:hypothetical protein
MGMFEKRVSGGMPRRALLIVPFAFAGLVAVSSRKERRLPNAAANGGGGQIALILFSN